MNVEFRGIQKLIASTERRVLTGLEKGIIAYIHTPWIAEAIESVEDHVASGTLIRSFNKTVQMYKSKNLYSLTVSNKAVHAAVIHEGRRFPSKPPPIAAIIRWLNYPRIRSVFRDAIDDKGVESVAYGIAINIGRHGFATIRHKPYNNSSGKMGLKYFDRPLAVHGTRWLSQLKKSLGAIK